MIWGDALRTTLLEFDGKEFAWASRDCIQFVSTYVKHCIGVDHASTFAYHSEETALRLVAEFGGLEGLIETCLGPSHSDARPGDVVVCHVEDLHVPGISNGSYVWAFVKERGLSRLLLSSVLCGWSI